MKDSDDNDEETEKHATVEISGLPKSAPTPKTFNQIMESLDERKSGRNCSCSRENFREVFF